MKWIRLFVLSMVVFVVVGCNFIYPQEKTPEPPAVKEAYAQATEMQMQMSTPTIIVEEPTNTPIPVTATSAPTPTPTLVTEYTVQEGDTLSGIAEEFDSSVQLLALINDEIEYINLIFPDQTILLPNPLDFPKPRSQTGKEIVIKVSTQQLFAFEDGKLINSFIVSTGLMDTPTLKGDDYFIYSKFPLAPMTGPGYNHSDVPSVMYYSGSYGIHGTTWHDNFGEPMSYGCTNMSVGDAKWLFDWTPEETPVTVVIR